MIENYLKHEEERNAQGVSGFCRWIPNRPPDSAGFYRIPPPGKRIF